MATVPTAAHRAPTADTISATTSVRQVAAEQSFTFYLLQVDGRPYVWASVLEEEEQEG